MSKWERMSENERDLAFADFLGVKVKTASFMGRTIGLEYYTTTWQGLYIVLSHINRLGLRKVFLRELQEIPQQDSPPMEGGWLLWRSNYLTLEQVCHAAYRVLQEDRI